MLQSCDPADEAAASLRKCALYYGTVLYICCRWLSILSVSVRSVDTANTRTTATNTGDGEGGGGVSVEE